MGGSVVSFWTHIGSAIKAFGESKESASLATKGAGGWFNMFTGGREEEGQLVDPYTQSLYAMAGINLIGRNLASAKLEVHADEKGGSAPIEDPKIGEWKSSPAKGLKWSQFIDGTNIWLKATGHFFWLMGDEWLLPYMDVAARPAPLVLANANRMRPVREDGEVVGWSYVDDGGKSHALLPQNVIRIGYYNPTDPFSGLSPLKAARMTLEADFYSSRFFRNAMKSNGEKGSIITAKTGGLSGPQEKQIKATIREHARLRAAGEVAPLFFTGEVDVKDPQVMAIDASFFEGSRLTGEKIYLALGLPPSMSGKFESNSIGSASDYYRALTEAYMPTGDLICDGIDMALQRLLGKPVFSSFNWNDHPVMQEVREAKTDTAKKYWDMGMPAKDVSDYLGLGLPRFKGDTISYLPFSVAPVGSMDFEDPANSPSTAETNDDSEAVPGIEEDEDVQAMFTVLASIADKSVEPEAKAPRLNARERGMWAQQMKLRRPWEKKTGSAFTRELMTARKEVLANIGNLDTGKSGEATFKGVAEELMFNLSTWKAGLLRRMRKVGAETLKEAGEEEWRSLEQSDPFNQPTPFVDQFLRTRENFLSGVADNVFRSVKRQLEAGIEAGESTAKLAGRVRAQFNKISDYAATRIAQTEVGHAFEAARAKAQEQAGVQYKKWLSTGNGNVRDSHEAAHGQIVPIDEPFNVGGHQLMHPLDSSLGAPPGEVINCHCISIAVRKPD